MQPSNIFMTLASYMTDFYTISKKRLYLNNDAKSSAKDAYFLCPDQATSRRKTTQATECGAYHYPMHPSASAWRKSCGLSIVTQSVMEKKKKVLWTFDSVTQCATEIQRYWAHMPKTSHTIYKRKIQYLIALDWLRHHNNDLTVYEKNI